ELDHHRWGVSDDPAIVARFDRNHLWSPVLTDAAIKEFHVNLSARQKSDMGVHAIVGADLGFHVLRPTKADRIDHALDAAISGWDNVNLHPANGVMICTFDRRQQRVIRGHGISPCIPDLPGKKKGREVRLAPQLVKGKLTTE